MPTRINAVIGAAAAVEILDNTLAPRKAASAPGSPSLNTVGQCTFPKRQWLMPDTSVVPSSAVCTTAEACAGPRPAKSSMVVEVTPKPMPIPPSTSCAAAPARAIRMNDRIFMIRSVQACESGWTGPLHGQNGQQQPQQDQCLAGSLLVQGNPRAGPATARPY